MTRGDTDNDLSAQSTTDFSEAGDAYLAVAMARGHRGALAEVYERHGGAVYEMACRLGGESFATKVVQQTFLDLWRAPDDFDPSGTLQVHLLTRSHLTAVDQLRTKASRATRAPGSGQWDTREGDRPSSEPANHVWPQLSRLPANERSAIMMTYFVGYTARELALRLHEPEHVIRQRIVDGLRRLRSNGDAAGTPASG